MQNGKHIIYLYALVTVLINNIFSLSAEVSQSVIPKPKLPRTVSRRYKDRLAHEQKFMLKVEADLLQINMLEKPYEKIKACLVLLKAIIENRDITKKVRISLFEHVEDHIKKVIRESNIDINNELRALTITKPGGHPEAMNMEVIGNVNATSKELQNLLDSLAAIKNNLQKTADETETPISWGQLIGIPVGVSVLFTCLIYLAVEAFRPKNENNSSISHAQIKQIATLVAASMRDAKD